MRAIFQMMIPASGSRPIVNAPQEEEKNSGDHEMIDASSLANFKPPYMDQKQKVDVQNMEDFMDPVERERAQTYYQQVQQQAEEKMCKFCDK